MNKHILAIPVAEGFFPVFDQYAGLQLRLLVFANPGKFEFLLAHGRATLILVQAKLVKQDAVAAFSILDELVIGEDLDIPIARR